MYTSLFRQLCLTLLYLLGLDDVLALRIKIWTVSSADTNFIMTVGEIWDVETRFGTKFGIRTDEKKFTSTFVDTAENRRDLSCPSSLRDLVMGQSRSKKFL